MIDQVLASMANPPQTVSTVTAATAELAAEVAGGGQPARGERRRSVAGIGGVVDQINFNSGDDVPAGAVLLRLRSQDDVAKLAGACRRARPWRRSL